MQNKADQFWLVKGFDLFLQKIVKKKPHHHH